MFAAPTAKIHQQLVKVLIAPALAVLLVLAAAAVASLLAVLLALFSELVVPARGSY